MQQKHSVSFALDSLRLHQHFARGQYQRMKFANFIAECLAENQQTCNIILNLVISKQSGICEARVSCLCDIKIGKNISIFRKNGSLFFLEKYTF